MNGCVIGYDFGSQGARAVVCDGDGQLLGSASCSYPVLYPRPLWAEQSPRHWLQALAQLTRLALEQAARKGGQVLALGLDGYVDSVLPVDERLQPLRPAFLWMDRRAVDQCEAVERTISPDRLFELTGLNLDPSHGAAKILWIRENEPELYARTHKFLPPASYLVAHLTGEVAVDYSNASSTMLLDLRSRAWSEELLESVGLAKEQLPTVRPATVIAGTLLPEIAAHLGLPAGIPVVVGCGDEHAACLGAGVVEPGIVCDIGGTAEAVAAVVKQPVLDETRLVETHCHADPDAWLMENPGFVSGANLRWFKDHFGGPDLGAASGTAIDSYDLLTSQAESIPHGSDGLVFLPCLMGAMTPEWNPDACGVLFGLRLHHHRAHVIRAIMEGSAYGLRDILDRMAGCGLQCHEVRAVGGQARSRLWRQIKADVTDAPVTSLATDDTACLGAAMLAAVAAGLQPSLIEAAAAFVRLGDTVYPNPVAHEIYDDYYELYRDIYSQLRDPFAAASRMSREHQNQRGSDQKRTMEASNGDTRQQG